MLRTDAVGLIGGFVPLTDVDERPVGAEPLGGDVGYTTVEAWGGLPPWTAGGGTLITGLSWQRIAFRYEHPEQIAAPRTLHEVGATLLYLRPLSRRWTLMAIGLPSLNSDFDGGLGASDLFVSGASAFRWQATSQLNVGIGAYLTWVFGDVVVLPMVDVMYAGPRLLFELAFPRSTVLYRIHERIEVGLTAFVDGGQYNFGDDALPAGGRVDHVELSSVNLGPVLTYDVGRGWLLNLQAGVVTGQRYEVFDEEDQAVPGGDASLADTRFLRAGLTWRFSGQ